MRGRGLAVGAVVAARKKLALLVDDLAVRSRPAQDFGEPDCPDGLDDYYTQDLVGLTRWGDVVAVRGVCREFLAAQGQFWTPSPRTQRILDGLRR